MTLNSYDKLEKARGSNVWSVTELWPCLVERSDDSRYDEEWEVAGAERRSRSRFMIGGIVCCFWNRNMD
ncbi:MAG: hypothetical protein ACLU6Y_02835 [Ruminococcus sp.]